MLRVYRDRIVYSTGDEIYQVPRKQVQVKKRGGGKKKNSRPHRHQWDLKFEDTAFMECRSCRKRRYPERLKPAGTRRVLTRKSSRAIPTGGLAWERRK